MSWCHIYYITSIILYIFSGYVTGSEYYVSAAPNGEDCPRTELPCHNLFYYTTDYSSYFIDDTIFYFLEGTHILQGTLKISGISNIILQGLGHIEQGFHETVMQSTSVIMCNDYSRSAIQFTNSTDVVLKSITIANCWDFYYLPQNSGSVVYSLLFIDINNVILEWVSVQNVSGFGLILYNSLDMLIANSTFVNNGDLKDNVGNALIYYDDQAKRLSRVNIAKSNFTLGLGSGMTLWYDNNEIEVEVFIENSMFLHNTAQIGGGVLINLHNGRSSVEFSNCAIYNNTARNGGGVYIILYNRISRVEFSNCTIYNNTAQNGGGVYIILYNRISSVEFSNCTIYNNTAQNGGGVNIILINGSGSIAFNNSIIYNNVGYYGSGLIINAFLLTSTPSIRFTNVSFQFNKLPNMLNIYQSAVLLMNIRNVIFDQIDISNHNTTGLVSINSAIKFDGHSTFVNNSGINGGGIALYGSSQLYLNHNTNIYFVNNHASESGGGIFVSQVIDSSDVTICTFVSFPYNDGTNIMLYFVNNTADISGDVLYGGQFSNCINYDFDHLFCYPNQTGLSVVSSDPIQVCFCELNRQNCSITNVNITAIPGVNVNILLATVGNKDGLTKGAIKLTTSDSSLSTVQTDNTRLNAICTNVTFKLRANPSLNTTLVYVIPEGIIKDFSSEINATKVIEVNIESCPIGYLLANDACSCRSELNTPPITCDINTQIITRDGDMWIGYKNDSDCLIVYQNCPFDYCNNEIVHFKITSPDPQCLHNRSGILCGQCAEGFSLMLGSNKCRVCTNHYLALIAAFVFAGLCLCVILLTLNLTMSVGSINGLLFYANMVKLNRSVLFSSGQIPVLSQFIAWLNLDLGIETCFFNGLDGYWKTWLQFAFSLSLITGLIICCRYSGKLSRLCGNNVVPVLSTLILMAHSKLLITIKNALMLSRVQCEHTVWNVWSVDGNIKYLHDKHIPLFVVSLIFLFFGFVYTGLILSSQWLQRYTGKYCRSSIDPFIVLKPFIDAYNGPYKNKSRFWTGLLLMMRLFVTGLFAVTTGIVPQVNNYVITIIVIILLPASRGIYKVKTISALEMFFLFNLGFISLLNTVSNHKTFTYWVDLISVGLSLIVFTGVVLAHIYMYIKRKCASKMNIFKQRNQTNEDEPLLGERSSEGQTEEYSPARTVLRRESLIFEFEMPVQDHDI